MMAFISEMKVLLPQHLVPHLCVILTAERIANAATAATAMGEEKSGRELMASTFEPQKCSFS